MTSSSTWKGFERRVADLFGGRRVPLSGGNSGHTRADVMGVDGLFIEAKLRAKSALWSLFDNTKPMAVAEDKIPVLAIARKHSNGFIVCVHSGDLDAFIEQYVKNKTGWSNDNGFSDASIYYSTALIEQYIRNGGEVE